MSGGEFVASAVLRQPSLVSLPFGRKQRIKLFCFDAIEQQILWQFLLTDAAPAVTPTVNDRVAGGTVLFGQADADSGG